jgi:hypothetical protein
MAYLGNAPARSFISFERQVFTIVNSQTAYTLDHSVNNENDLRLVINNIVQEPGSGKAYTASGTTLTLSAALTNGTDEMYCVFLGRAVATNAPGAGSVNTAAIADNAVTSAKLTYPLTTFSSTGIDDNADANAITINSSEQVGIGTTSPTTPLEIRGSTPHLSIRDSSGHGSIISWHGGVDALGRHGIYYGSSSSNEVDINEYGDIYFSAGKTGGSNPHDGRKIKMDTGGNLLLLSGGLFLGGTGSANNLDDYEEGTFTPTIGPDDGLSSVSYTTQSGVYTKVGRIVHFRLFLRCSGTANGNDINIYGLPFTSSTSEIGGAVFAYLHSSIINSTSTNPPVLQIPTNNTFIKFQKTNGSDFTGNDLSSTGDIQFYITGTYETA